MCCVSMVLQKKKELGKLESQKCVWFIDCCYGHIDLSFRQWVREQYPWLLVLYIPAACSSKFQPCDLVLNKRPSRPLQLRRLLRMWLRA